MKNRKIVKTKQNQSLGIKKRDLKKKMKKEKN